MSHDRPHEHEHEQGARVGVTTTRSLRAASLIRFDWIAGATAGVLVLVLHQWLTALYQLPRTLLLFIGCANLAYACVSFTLDQRRQGERVPFLRAMAVANMLWAIGCAIMAAVWAGRASLFGMGQLIGEGLFVGWLGLLEWRAGGPSLAHSPFD